jgi:hypothetical protein
MIHYDSAKDRSEEFGWRKVCDEHVPTEKEQDRAAWSIIILTIGLAIIALTGV